MLRKVLVWLLCSLPVAAYAETGRDAWLRYAPVDAATAARDRAAVPAVIVAVGSGAPVASAQQELVRGLHGLLGLDTRAGVGLPAGGAIVIGTLADLRAQAAGLAPDGALGPDAFRIRTVLASGGRYVVIAGGNDRGVLYGAFAFLRRIGVGDPVANIDQAETPYAPVRWANQWDNPINNSGTIERGYGGRSIFWENGHARQDLTRVGEYGRLLASLGINGLSISNVNADPKLLAPDLLPDIARIADAMRPWGVRIAISIDFGSPQSLGGLPTYDPLDPAVIAWWRDKVDGIYRVVPDFGGLVLKADSEGRVGPSTYHRTHADAANVVARALKPHGGVIFYRGFVYDHMMDWRNLKNDRGRAAYDNFHPLDGQFDDNVIVQIKNGPIDFQVREPASPLFSGLEKTNQAIELQVTQEYFGQSRHTVFLVPMWKTTLDFDLHALETGSVPPDGNQGQTPTPVKAIVAGKTFHRPTGGLVGVVNIGLDDDWSGNHLSQANLYGFGRLAWNPDLSAEKINDEWARLTFGSDPAVLKTVAAIQLTSWRTFENYTGPLGLQTLTDITGNHYGVNVEASERNGWGQWHRADDKGVGMDRTVATGTGFIGQYHPAVSKLFETEAACPDDLLLFMHHVPYTYVLHDGKTVIQYIYDSHYEGANAVAGYLTAWEALKGKVDAERYEAVRKQLEYQAGQAVVWRDAVTTWFWKASGIADAKGRVGHYPGRMEAEAATLVGYAAVPVTPAEDASGATAVECRVASCTATFKYTGTAGRHDLVVQYFDFNSGVSHFRVRVGEQVVAEWAADDIVPSARMDSSTSARKTIAGVMLRPSDAIVIEGLPDMQPLPARGRAGAPAPSETAALDYIEVH